jgi:hypothetical protein
MTDDRVTVALTGTLPFILIVSGFLGFALSVPLLQLYRRAVKRGMCRTTAPTAAVAISRATRSAPFVPPPPPPAPLVITYVDPARTNHAADGGNLYRRARTAPWQAAAIYTGAGTAAAAVLALAFLLASAIAVQPLRFLLLLWTYAWPLVLTLSLIAAATRRQKLLLSAAYATVYGLLICTIVIVNQDLSTVAALVAFWIFTNLPPTLVFAAFLLRRVRAVGPLVVTFLLFAVAGTSLLQYYLAGDDQALRVVADFFFALGLGGQAAFVALTVTSLALFGVVGWIATQWLRRAYEAKLINDQSLILDAIWLFFGIVYTVELAFHGALWAVAGLVAFVAYLTIVRLGFRWFPVGGAPQDNSLLLLRVFSLGKRSEALFEAVSRNWRYVGTVQLIAGPDLTTATVEPHEFLDFVSGRLDRQFIDGPSALDRRITDLDTRPDFDGRFRVNDFFCHDDTWQPTLAALVPRSSAALMDLREFTPQRQGCLYEIQQLLHHMPVERIVILVDSTTAIGFLEQSVTEAWKRLAPWAPNRGAPEPRLNVIRASRETEGDIDAVLAAACQAATSSSGRGRGDRRGESPHSPHR